MDEPKTTESKYVRFVSLGTRPGRKTECWSVQSKETGDLLGDVRWWSAWRRYSFWPADHTVFEQTCLRDIANFIEDRTRAR